MASALNAAGSGSRGKAKRPRPSDSVVEEAAKGTVEEPEPEEQGSTSSEEEDEEFPVLDLGSASDEDEGSYDDDDDEEGSSEDDEDEEEDDAARIAAELAAEAASDSDGESSTSTLLDPLDSLIRRSTSKPDEAEQGYAPLLRGGEAEAEISLPVDFMRRARVVKSSITGKEIQHWEGGIEPNYDSDSSTEETENRVGKVPQRWYDDLPHIGYDMEGRKVMRPAVGDELDRFLAGVEGEDGGWTTVTDKLHQKDVQLTEEELDLIHRLAKHENPDADYDPYEPTIEYFSSKVESMPISHAPEPKRRFLPSKWEHKKVMKIVRAIRAGRITPGARATSLEDSKPRFYALWENEGKELGGKMHMPMPKQKLPGHEESYNPPAEYLWTAEEEEEHAGQEEEDKKGIVVPRKFDSLRQVPAYSQFVQERFDRCLDLYLAPRSLRRRPKLDIKGPEDLLPQLPEPKDLRPFPTQQGIVYEHPRGVKARCVSVDPKGVWVLTGGSDGVVRMWELSTGRETRRWAVGSPDDDDATTGAGAGAGGKGGRKVEAVVAVEWSPDEERPLFVAATPSHLFVLSPLALLDPALAKTTKDYAISAFTAPMSEATKAANEGNDVRWSRGKPSAYVRPEEEVFLNAEGEEEEREGEEGEENEWLVSASVPGQVKQVTWHRRGDYFASVAANAGTKAVLIHQLTKRQTQAPFKKQGKGGEVQRVAFHPTKAWFFVATQRHVRVYDLLGQRLVKQLITGLRWISSLAVHPWGDNVIAGSYDKRLAWHDLDLGTTPYKSLKYHSRAIRSVAFSPKYPLFLSSSDDGTIHVFHSKVARASDDDFLSSSAMIVPLKVLKGHAVSEGLGVLDAVWHPKEPWIVSVGADGDARLWCN